MIVQQWPELSVVIVNYFSERELARCLDSIEANQEAVEVVVADNGSEPRRRAAVVKAHPLPVWKPMGGNRGFSAASNRGAALASSPRLLFLNPDATVCTGAFRVLIEALDSAEYGSAILGCGIRNADGTRQLSCRRFPDWRTFVAGRFSLLTRLFPTNSWSARYLMRDYPHERAHRADWVSGAALAMSRRTFEELNGFDERYFLYFEDVDLCRRAAARGIPTYYFPEAEVEHQIGGSSRRAPVRALAYRHRSMWTYYRRYHGRLWLDPLAAALIGGRLAALAAGHLASDFHLPGRSLDLPAHKTSK